MAGTRQRVSRSSQGAGRSGHRAALAAALVCVLGLACADEGKKLIGPALGPEPRIDRLIPTRTVTADTVRVEGSNFGAIAADGEVTFAGGSGRIVGTSVVWSDSAITVLVPEGAVDGAVTVSTSAGEGAGKAFSVALSLVRYSSGLLPLLTGAGCVDCHSGDFGTNNLRLESVPDILRGDSVNGPVIIRRNGPGSLIVRKVGPNPPIGERMPLGCSGACLNDAQILSISDWIDQGTRDN